MPAENSHCSQHVLPDEFGVGQNFPESFDWGIHVDVFANQQFGHACLSSNTNDLIHCDLKAPNEALL